MDLSRLKAEKGVTGLTAGEVIALLEGIDPLTPVLMPVENGGLDGVAVVRASEVRFNVNGLEGFGPHEVAVSGETPDATAILLLPAAGAA